MCPPSSFPLGEVRCHGVSRTMKMTVRHGSDGCCQWSSLRSSSDVPQRSDELQLQGILCTALTRDPKPEPACFVPQKLKRMKMLDVLSCQIWGTFCYTAVIHMGASSYPAQGRDTRGAENVPTPVPFPPLMCPSGLKDLHPYLKYVCSSSRSIQ